MAEGRQRSEWGKTAEVLAMLFNELRGLRGEDRERASSFNPMADTDDSAADDDDVLRVPMGDLAKMIVGQHGQCSRN